MSYWAGEARLAELIQGAAGFDRRNVTRGDWKPLNSGKSDHYAVLKAGPFTNTADAIGNGAAVTTWRTVIEVWQRWIDDSPTVQSLQVHVQTIIEHLERYPSLGTAGVYAWVSGGGDMQQRWLKDGGPMWAVWEVYVDWQEERFIDGAE